MTAPTVTALHGVNAFDPSLTFLITFDGEIVYATPDDYWLQVNGTHLDTVTDVAFTKSGEADRPAQFNILSPTLLEVRIPYTVLDHSRVRVTNPDGDATSVRSVTPIFAGPWQTPETVHFDNLDHPGALGQYPTVTERAFDSYGSKTIGPQTDGSAPPLSTFADVVDTDPGVFSSGSGAGAAGNVIVNQLIDPSIVTTAPDDAVWTVTQAAVLINLTTTFYNLLADQGVPGYYDPGLLPAGAAQAVPDGTDLAGPFFDARISALTLTVTGRNRSLDGYRETAGYTGPSGDWLVYDPSVETDQGRADVLEFRRATTLGTIPGFRGTTALTAATLITSATINPDVALRVPAGQELQPVAPIYPDPADVTIDIPAAADLSGTRVAYTTVMQSSRTYDDPPDPGQPPLLTFTIEGNGPDSIQDAQLTRGSGFGTDGQVRVRATWHPPRYRYFYTTPLPFTVPPLRQVQRDDGERQLTQTSQQASIRQGPRGTYL